MGAEGLFPVVAYATVATPLIVPFRNRHHALLHGKSDIDVTEPAGMFGPVNPVTEDDRGHLVLLRRLIQDDSTVFFRRNEPSPLSPRVRNSRRSCAVRGAIRRTRAENWKWSERNWSRCAPSRPSWSAIRTNSCCCGRRWPPFWRSDSMRRRISWRLCRSSSGVMESAARARSSMGDVGVGCGDRWLCGC